MKWFTELHSLIKSQGYWGRYLIDLLVTGCMPRWFTRPESVNYPNRPSNPAEHDRKSNSQPVDHESDALTTTLHHQATSEDTYISDVVAVTMKA